MMRPSSSSNHWDRYWKKKSDLGKVYSNEGRIADNLEKVTALSGKVILEVGAGTGRDSADLSRKGAIVVVLDNSFEAIDRIRDVMESEGVKLIPIIGDALSLPFASESFQVVFHQGLLEHFEEPRCMLLENNRVLEKGGHLLVDVPQRYHPYTAVKHVLMILGKWFAGWETEYTIRSLTNTVAQAGFNGAVYRYGVWMNPSFFYRSLREMILGLGIELPMYPSSCSVIKRVRNRLRELLSKRPAAFYTYHTIGVIVKK
jgi:ubiquinone/menaquinone biosynthesis C-methylase UbiE